jgi:hypothetical protein
MFSPPTSSVRVRTHLVPGEERTFLLSIEDVGIGLSDEHLQAANELLADPPEVDPRRSTLGFHVVGRLALRLGLRVSLAHTPGGGVTALVTLPPDVVGERWLPAPEVTSPAVVAPAFAGAVGSDGPPWIVNDHELARAPWAPSRRPPSRHRSRLPSLHRLRTPPRRSRHQSRHRSRPPPRR